jgi:hypothetical protein
MALLVANAGAQDFQSAVTRTNVIELFTSEGCSSCPPADEWMASLRRSKSLWKTFIPLGFHVDYWNKLGWTDRFSRTEFTTRQQQYATDWRNWRVYTPAFVVNGEEWRQAEGGLPAPKAEKIGVLTARFKSKRGKRARYALTYAPATPEEPPTLLSRPRGFTAYGALLGNGLVTKVAAGENEGKTIRHEFVVLALGHQKMERKEEGALFEALVELEHTGGAAPKSFSVAFWVAPSGQQRPVQAVGGDFGPTFP